MTEKPPSQPPELSPEERQKQEEEARYKAWMDAHPEKVIAPDDRLDCEPEIAEFHAMIDAFESEHSLDALHAIVDLTPQEAPNHPIWEPARKALAPIVAKLNKIKKETNISSERFEEVQARYKKISRAVGIINNNKVAHDR